MRFSAAWLIFPRLRCGASLVASRGGRTPVSPSVARGYDQRPGAADGRRLISPIKKETPLENSRQGLDSRNLPIALCGLPFLLRRFYSFSKKCTTFLPALSV